MFSGTRVLFSCLSRDNDIQYCSRRQVTDSVFMSKLLHVINDWLTILRLHYASLTSKRYSVNSQLLKLSLSNLRLSNLKLSNLRLSNLRQWSSTLYSFIFLFIIYIFIIFYFFRWTRDCNVSSTCDVCFVSFFGNKDFADVRTIFIFPPQTSKRY